MADRVALMAGAPCGGNYSFLESNRDDKECWVPDALVLGSGCSCVGGVGHLWFFLPWSSLVHFGAATRDAKPERPSFREE